MPDQPSPVEPAVYDIAQDEDGLWRVVWAATGAVVVLDGIHQSRMAYDDALDLMDGLEALDAITVSRGSKAVN